MDADNIRTIHHTLHTNLTGAHPGEKYRLFANGHRYELTEHTAESRAAHGDVAPHLANLLKDLTHYTAEPVKLPDTHVFRVHLEHTLTTFGAAEGATGSYHCAIVHPPAKGQPHTSHDKINWTSTAEALIFHHPDLITQDPDVAKIVFSYMEDDKKIVDMVDELASFMSGMGAPTLEGESTPGWATLVPILTENGEETSYFQQEPSQAVIDAAGQVMTAMMIATKNDPALENRKWTQAVGSSVVSPQPPEASLLAELGGASDDWKAKLTNAGEQHGLETTLTVTDAGKRTVHVKMDNSYVRWLGVYIAFYDAEGAMLDIRDWDFDLGSLWRNIVPENEYYRCLGWIEPMGTLLAVPTDKGRLNDGDGVTFSFPSNATSAKIFGCGLGTGEIPYGDAIIIGGMLTGLCNYAIPSALLAFAVAANSYKELYKLTKNPTVVKVVVGVGVLYFGKQFTTEAVSHHKCDFHALSSLIGILLFKGMEKMLLWVEKELVEGELEDAIPFAGWIVAAMKIATGMAQIAETTTAVATSPWFIKNTVTLSITSTVTVHPDPRHDAWPQGQSGTTKKCIAKMIYKGQARPTVSQTFQLPADFTEKTIDFRFEGNTLGGEVKIEADFYINDWLAGQAQSGWLPNEENAIESTTLYLVEAPKPITADSKFKHSAITVYEGGKVQWHETAQAPTATIADLKTSSNANEISECVGLTLSQRRAVLGAAWKAAGTGLTPCSGGGTNTQIYAVQSLNIPGREMSDVKFVSCGTMEQSMLMYDPYPPKFEMDANNQWVLDEKTRRPVPDPKDMDLGDYYIDPSKSQVPLEDGGGYHLRRVDVRGTGDFDPRSDKHSHGRFPYFPDHVTMHPSGHVIGVSQKYSKVMVLNLNEEGAADKDIPVASDNAGKALIKDREGLLFSPVAISCSYDGTILILDQIFGDKVNEARIQAFDLLGRPVQCFHDAGGTGTAILPVPTGVVYLDLAVVGNRDMTHLFLLYYTGSGQAVSDYNVAVYKYGEESNTSDMKALVTTNGVPAARICVDMWHTLYTLNYQMVESSKRTVPSISEWVLPVPVG